MGTEDRLAKLERRLAALEGRGTTFVGVIQDKSLSMRGREDATISGFNEYIESLQSKANEDGFKYRLTLTQFDTTINRLYDNVELSKVEVLNRSRYVPNGATALFDAIGDGVNAISERMGSDDRALILVMTDGEENSSQRFNRHQINALIKEKEATDKWTFVYLGADQDAWAVGTGLGFSGQNTYAYDNTPKEIRTTFNRLAGATHSHSHAGGGTMSNFASSYMSGPITPPTIDPVNPLWVPQVDSQDEEEDDA